MDRVKGVGQKRCCFGDGEGVTINPGGKGGAAVFLRSPSPALGSPGGASSLWQLTFEQGHGMLNSYNPPDNLIYSPPPPPRQSALDFVCPT